MAAAAPQPGQPVVFRNATVLTMDDAHTILTNADVLVSGERIAAVGPALAVPDGTAEIDAADGIVMPGMVDTHRHLMLIENDNSPVGFPVLHPYGHVVYQANRGDVHTVLVNGTVVKHDHRLVGVDLAAAKAAIESTIEYLRGEQGETEWANGMHPEVPAHEALANPYTYRDDVSAWKDRPSAMRLWADAGHNQSRCMRAGADAGHNRFRCLRVVSPSSKSCPGGICHHTRNDYPPLITRHGRQKVRGNFFLGGRFWVLLRTFLPRSFSGAGQSVPVVSLVAPDFGGGVDDQGEFVPLLLLG